MIERRIRQLTVIEETELVSFRGYQPLSVSYFKETNGKYKERKKGSHMMFIDSVKAYESILGGIV